MPADEVDEADAARPDLSARDENGTADAGLSAAEAAGNAAGSPSHEAPAQLQASLAAIVENASDFVGYATMDGSVQYVNEAGRDMVGLESLEEARTAELEAFFFEEDRSYVEEHLLPRVRQQGRWKGEFRFRHFETGKPILVLYDQFLIYDEETGEPSGYVTITHNITEAKRKEHALQQAREEAEAAREQAEAAQEELRESEVNLHLLMENLDEYAIFTLDEKGKIVSWNAAAGKLFQYSKGDVLGRVGSILYSAEDRGKDVPKKRLEEARQSGQARDYRWMVRKDGSRFWAYAVTVALYDENDRMRGYARIVRDVSARKRSDEKIARVREESQRAQEEAEEARRRAEQSRSEAERANEAKSQFLANMSHELRTPLNSIIGYGDMILEEIDAQEQETMAEDLERILSSGRHLLSLVNDVLDLSKIEAGQMELDLGDFAVESLVTEAADLVRPHVEENGSRLEVACEDDLPEMHADETKLRQSLDNLLANAAKFTEDGVVSISACRARRDGRAGVRFEVADTGVGMTEEEQQDLFEAFEQASEKTSTQYGGTGLGLAITRNMCRLMGGAIEMKSEKGAGSTFTIWLPVWVEEEYEQGPAFGMAGQAASGAPAPSSAAGAAGPSAEQSAAPSAGAEPKSNTVLVVDDDADVRELLKRHLSRRGFQVETAANAATGLRAARRLQPLAITLDVRMPDMDGWEALSLIQEDPRIDDDVRVIMLTIVDDGERGYHLGADDFLTKPIDREKLSSKLERYRSSTQAGAVLVVEDDDNTRDLLQRTLERDGYAVHVAADGREGLQCLEEEDPGLVLLDLMMPRMDGFEFLEALRKDEEHAGIPVIVITAKELGVEERRYLSSQVEETLQKSEYTCEQLLAEVEERLAAARSEEANSEDSSASRPVPAAVEEEGPGHKDRSEEDEAQAAGSGATFAEQLPLEEATGAEEPVRTYSGGPDAEGAAEREESAAVPSANEQHADEATPPSGAPPAADQPGSAEAGEQEDAGRESTNGRRPDGEEPVILLVEDNEHNYNMLSRRLRRRGYQIELATDGQEGLDKAGAISPDLILMDINLPVLGGEEATRRIRASPEGADVPIIALTAHAMSGDREEALEAGCDRYHSKPVELPKLLRQIEELLEQ